ncbi:cytochrome b/b6 domain-containing protein [Halorussus sp. MSC15.2]|uniref:cytochrome b/b6 domain-containing protein n=1 Tax=Halorussus sp. MSC15.2 TaxID=2283638 RepID=UPI0013D0881E|nr:cytochrome b/b6 domain-containing protein [Halorussus sp. MSC15.2]NEU56980.1 cytochrome b/b6 domain-containing protein [Halorussus sp. MSC15.2]
MTNLDHGKFTRTTTIFHSLLALDVFALFFTGYAVMFNDELWWLVTLMGGNTGVLAVHRLAGMGLVALVVFWITLTIITPGGRRGVKAAMPSKKDVEAAIQDVKFALGRAEERHPHARQFAGYSADEVPLLSYVGKGVVWIFSIELVLLMLSGLLIWNKVGLMQYLATRTAALAFVTFHGLLGVIMLMGVMFHIFEHGFHPAFYPVELKAFVPRDLTPGQHDEKVVEETAVTEEVVTDEEGRVVEDEVVVTEEERIEEERHEGTGIEQLTLSPSWNWAANLMGVLTVVGIVSVLVGSIFDEGYPVPRELTIGGGPTNALLTVGINVGILVLFVGLVLSMYGNVLRKRYEAQLRERRETPMADGSGDD